MTVSWDIPTLSWLKHHAQVIHYFGLGFIQIKINDALRFHFYVDSLPRIVDDEEVHNHRYSFRSYILAGELEHHTWTELRGNTHQLYNVSCKPGETDELVRVCTPGRLTESLMSRRSTYWIRHDVYHQVASPFSITRIERANPEYRREKAQVIRGYGKPAVCPFSLKLQPDELWNTVERSLQVASRSS